MEEEVLDPSQEEQEQPQDIAGEEIETQESAQAEPAQTAQQVNFKRLRQQKEQTERELEATRRKLMEYEQPKAAPAEDDFELANDDLAEGRHLKKVDKSVKELSARLVQYEQRATEAKLLSKYSDFDSVVSEENITRLAEQHPEIARTIDSSKDLYSKAVSAYTMIKNLGIAKEDNYVNERALAQKNNQKPRPLTSMSPQEGKSPLTHANAFANGLTPELKNQLYKEMMEAKESA